MFFPLVRKTYQPILSSFFLISNVIYLADLITLFQDFAPFFICVVEILVPVQYKDDVNGLSFLLSHFLVFKKYKT